MGAFVVGSVAALATVVVGCTAVVDGTGQADQQAAPEYRASVSASVEASSSVSAAKESERQAVATTKAVHTACEDLSSSSVDVINALNAYVNAANSRPGDVPATVGPAMDALNRGIALAKADNIDALPGDLRVELTEWVDSMQAVVAAINDGGADIFNAAKDRLNTAKNNALQRCDGAY